MEKNLKGIVLSIYNLNFWGDRLRKAVRDRNPQNGG